jgi:hypothetical protein
MEADKMLDAGDLDGTATWRRVFDAVKQMRAETPAALADRRV